MDVVSSVAHAFEAVTTTLVHPVYFPYPYASTLHAARVSIAFQANVRQSRSKQSWGTHLAGYMIMAWGGGVISHVLLGLPPPQLYSVHPYINYLAVHFVLTAFFGIFPAALLPRLFDTLLFPLDAILRVNAITAAVNLLSAAAVDARLRASPLTHAILGAIGSAGGGTSAATLGTWTHAWALSTPVFLRGRSEPGLIGWAAGTVDTLDLWAGSLIACLYSILTASPAFAGFANSAKPDAPQSMSPLDAKAVCCLVLGSLFGVRLSWVHWRNASTTETEQESGSGNKKDRKVKVQ